MKPSPNQWVLITGASSGIGKSFAHELAAHGYSLILIARSKTKLVELATHLATKHAIKTVVIVSDLSAEGAAAKVYQECTEQGLSVDVLINNAGIGTFGVFAEMDADRQHREMMLNAVAVVDLTQLFLPAMLQRGSGTIINVASTASFQPIPYMAVYGATKAFVLSFTEALWEENRRRGVQFLALCPGTTKTSFFEAMGTEAGSVGKQATPEYVVKRALQSLEAGKAYVIPGLRNYVIAQAARFLTRKQILGIVAQLFRTREHKQRLESTR